MVSVASVGLAATAAAARGQDQTWELIDGHWQAVATAPTTQAVSDETLDRVESLIGRGQQAAARKVCVTWLQSHKGSSIYDRALLLMARAYYAADDRITAFYYCDQLMDEYPSSGYFQTALKLQYQIADEFLSGHKMRFLGMPIVDANQEAIEMLYRIQQRSPGSPLAERGLLRTADFYYATSEFDLAADAYAVYVRGYPRSPMVPRARLRQAFSNYAQFRGLKFDPTPLIDARAQLVDLGRSYPDLAVEENIASVIERIDATLAAKIYHIADFYLRTHQPRAAVYNLRFLIANYPESREAKRASDRLAKMPARNLTDPAPAPGAGYSPAAPPAQEPIAP